MLCYDDITDNSYSLVYLTQVVDVEQLHKSLINYKATFTWQNACKRRVKQAPGRRLRFYY